MQKKIELTLPSLKRKSNDFINMSKKWPVCERLRLIALMAVNARKKQWDDAAHSFVAAILLVALADKSLLQKLRKQMSDKIIE